jgi:hypothetical protein
MVDGLVKQVESLLADLAHPGSSHLPERINLREQCTLAIAEAHLAKPENVRVIGALGPSIVADPKRLRRLLSNLLTNAEEATGGEHPIEIRVRWRKNAVEIGVANTGSYISPELQAHIFRPYFTKGKAKGTGLGLTIAKSIAEAHKGSLSVESDRAKGTTFWLSLPQPQKSLCTAVIDDDPFVSESICNQLQTPCETFLDPSDFLLKLNARRLRKFGIIISDYYFAGPLTGADVARAVRERGYKNPPTLILCTDADVSEAERELFTFVVPKRDLAALVNLTRDHSAPPLGHLLGGKRPK